MPPIPPRVAFLAISILIVAVPWLLWRLAPVRRIAPLAVVQILAGVALGPSLLRQAAPALHAALFTRPTLAWIDGVSTLGVLLYVFVTGLHLDPAPRCPPAAWASPGPRACRSAP